MTKPQYLLIPATLFLAAACWGEGVFFNDPFRWYSGVDARITSVFCHRMHDRCIALPNGTKSSACARCTGIFSGAAVGAMFVLSFNAGPLLVFLVALNLADWLLGLGELSHSGNWLRFGLGISMGLLFSIAILQTSPLILLSTWKKKVISSRR